MLFHQSLKCIWPSDGKPLGQIEESVTGLLRLEAGTPPEQARHGDAAGEQQQTGRLVNLQVVSGQCFEYKHVRSYAQALSEN